MKNRKNIVAVLAVLILMVSAMVLFTACDHYHQYRLVGVWEVKKTTSGGVTLDYPIDILGVKVYSYVYFTADGKFGRAEKAAASGVKTFLREDEFDYSVKGKNIIFTRKGIQSSGSFELKGNKLILKEKLKGEDLIHEAVKTSSPSIEQIRTAPKQK